VQRATPTGIPRGVRRAFVIGLGAVVALAWLLPDPIIDVDPAQYADVAARLARSGDWLHLRDFNGPFVNKPPLAMWLQAGCMLVLGPTPVAARFPSLVLALLLVLATWWLGLELGGRDLARRAALFVACSVPVFVMVADPKVDLALTVFSALAVAAFLAARRRGAWVIVGWGCTALAVLSKGPIGLVLVGAAVVPSRPTRTWWHLAGLLSGVALAVPFYAAQGGDDRWYLLWAQGPGRLFSLPNGVASLPGSEFHDSTTPLFVLHTALWAWLPMTPAVLLSLWRRQGPRELWWWLAVTCGVIALARFKLPQYLFWATPTAAVLAAGVEVPKWVSWAVSAVSAVLGALVLGLMFPAGALTTVGLGLVLLAPLAIIARVDRATALATSTLGFLVFFAVWLHPSLAAYQPAGAIAERLRGTTQSSLPLVGVAPSFSLSFATGVPLVPMSASEVPAGLALVSLEEARGFDELARFEQYHVSLPRWPFLHRATRASQVETLVLVRVTRP
jgi:4-amino-4-deoxy-L-arabinose transferase-like glycosyltransferase